MIYDAMIDTYTRHAAELEQRLRELRWSAGVLPFYQSSKRKAV